MDTIEEHPVVASCPTRDEAVATLERLAEEGFPVRSAAIVGRDVHFVENVTGRQTAKRTVGTAAVVAAVLGAAALASTAAAGGALAAMTFRAGVIGAVAGLLVGLVVGAVMYRLGWPRRFRSSGLVAAAARFDVVAEPCLAPAARRLVGAGGPG